MPSSNTASISALVPVHPCAARDSPPPRERSSSAPIPYSSSTARMAFMPSMLYAVAHRAPAWAPRRQSACRRGGHAGRNHAVLEGQTAAQPIAALAQPTLLRACGITARRDTPDATIGAENTTAHIVRFETQRTTDVHE